jgi:hypothetical protein
MGILMYFFRGNQNFNKDNSILKILSYTWVLQNVVMIVSVVIRNYRYIDTHGLTYKRIGVYVFLLMTFMGLLTLIVKISSQRSNFFLWRTNSWLAYAVLVLFSFWNWDAFIAQYNMKIVVTNSNKTDVIALPDYETTNGRRSRFNNDKVDIDYLLALSDKALPALLKHPNFEDEYFVGSSGTLRQMVKYKYERLEHKMENRSWLSYNWAEAHALQQLKDYFEAHPEKVKEVDAEPVETAVEPITNDSLVAPVGDSSSYEEIQD